MRYVNKNCFVAIYFHNAVTQMSSEYQRLLNDFLSVYRILVLKWIADDKIDTH